jgi:hypothetical protein
MRDFANESVRGMPGRSGPDVGMARVLNHALGFSISLLIGAIGLALRSSVISALYSDWVLGAIARNLAGFLSGDVSVLYWSYFVAKRLPFLSF